MNVNSDASRSTQIPLRVIWRNSFFWSSTVLASLVLLGLEASLAAESAQASAAGDRPEVPSLKIDGAEAEINGAEAQIDLVEAEIDLAEAQINGAEAQIDLVEAQINGAEAQINGAEAEIDLAEAQIDGAEAEINGAEAQIDLVEAQINGAEAEIDLAEANSSAIAQQEKLSAQVTASAQSATTQIATSAQPNAKPQSRLQATAVIETLPVETSPVESLAESSREVQDGAGADDELPVYVEDDEEISVEETSAATGTSLRIPHVIDSTANDWSQVLASLQTEFFTLSGEASGSKTSGSEPSGSEPSGSETASVASSSEPIDELTQILASLEAEFFSSDVELDLDSSQPNLDAAIAPPLTVREPIVVSLNAGVEAIAWTGAEAESDWQPLAWECDDTDCYELSEADLISLSEMPLSEMPLSEIQIAQTSEDSAQIAQDSIDDPEDDPEYVPVPVDRPEANNESDNELATSGGALVLGSPYIQLQGAYVLQGDESSARVRATVLYPASPNLLFGATVDLAGGEAFANPDGVGLDLTELYATFSPPGTSGLRFTAGLMDLTSYFDRNSFAKDVVTHFFNPVFQTNPALSAAGLSSRIGALASWNPTDNIDVRATVFSSNRDLSEFALDAFAGEVGFRAGNLILRGTYVSAEDPGSGDGFEEVFGIDRGGEFGVQEGDREDAFGLNAEYFIPDLNLGLFARYGHYNNRDLDESADTYSFGLNLLDLFMPDDRLGLAYGRGLSNDNLRRDRGDEVPDVLELFYDFRLSPNLRAGATIQQRNEFSETVFGFRVRADLDVTGLGRQF